MNRAWDCTACDAADEIAQLEAELAEHEKTIAALKAKLAEQEKNIAALVKAGDGLCPWCPSGLVVDAWDAAVAAAKGGGK